MSDAAYELYHSKSEIDFKFIMNEFFLRISEFINKDNFDSIFFTNQSFRYSTKDSRLKRNSRLVKYILVEHCKTTQSDSVVMNYMKFASNLRKIFLVCVSRI